MARNTQRAYKREARIGPKLRDELARILLSEVRDERARQVQVVHVDVTRDLSVARVYYVLLDKTQADPELQQVLERATSFIRKQLSEVLDMRHTPQLTFIYDASVERGRHMETLLASLHIEPASDDQEES
jgi:ribosome-binding factor A